MYHTGNLENIKSLDRYGGTFGDFIFFGSEKYLGINSDNKVYEINIDELNIIDASSIFYAHSQEEVQSVIDDVINYFNCSEQEAMDLIDETITTWDLDGDFDGEDSWYMQQETARAAQHIGYDGVSVSDETGISTMIDMSKHLNLIVRVN